MKDNPIPNKIVNILGVFAISGLFMTCGLIYIKSEGSAIAIISGMTGTALGSISSILNRTHSETGQVEVTNDSSRPVPTTETP